MLKRKVSQLLAIKIGVMIFTPKEIREIKKPGGPLYHAESVEAHWSGFAQMRRVERPIAWCSTPPEELSTLHLLVPKNTRKNPVCFLASWHLKECHGGNYSTKHTISWW